MGKKVPLRFLESAALDGLFDLGKGLGCGTYGAVVAATPKTLDFCASTDVERAPSTVAVKILRPTDSTEKRDILDEIEVGFHLNTVISDRHSPGVVEVLDAFQVRSVPDSWRPTLSAYCPDLADEWAEAKWMGPFTLIVMELADGTLYDRMEAAAKDGDLMSKDEVRAYSFQLVWALYVLHFQKGVAHCDLKPSNIVLKEQSLRELRFVLGNAMWRIPYGDRPCALLKLIDFGLCWRQTQKPHIGGTIGYFSPDVLFTGSKERGFETDAWSLALLILEMATAGKPSNPQAENVTDLLWLHFVDMERGEAEERERQVSKARTAWEKEHSKKVKAKAKEKAKRQRARETRRRRRAARKAKREEERGRVRDTKERTSSSSSRSRRRGMRSSQPSDESSESYSESETSSASESEESAFDPNTVEVDIDKDTFPLSDPNLDDLAELLVMASRKRKAPYRFTDKRAATTALACSLLQRSMGHSLLPNPNDWEAVSDSIIFQLLDENIEALDAVDPAIYDALVSDAMDVLGRDGLEMVKALMGWSPQERTLHDANNERTLEAALYSDYFGGYYKKIRAWSHVTEGVSDMEFSCWGFLSDTVASPMVRRAVRAQRRLQSVNSAESDARIQERVQEIAALTREAQSKLAALECLAECGDGGTGTSPPYRPVFASAASSLAGTPESTPPPPQLELTMSTRPAAAAAKAAISTTSTNGAGRNKTRATKKGRTKTKTKADKVSDASFRSPVRNAPPPRLRKTTSLRALGEITNGSYPPPSPVSPGKLTVSLDQSPSSLNKFATGPGAGKVAAAIEQLAAANAGRKQKRRKRRRGDGGGENADDVNKASTAAHTIFVDAEHCDGEDGDQGLPAAKRQKTGTARRVLTTEIAAEESIDEGCGGENSRSRSKRRTKSRVNKTATKAGRDGNRSRYPLRAVSNRA